MTIIRTPAHSTYKAIQRLRSIISAVNGLALLIVGVVHETGGRSKTHRGRVKATITAGSGPWLCSARSGSPTSHSTAPRSNVRRPPPTPSSSIWPRSSTTSASPHSAASYARVPPGATATRRTSNPASVLTLRTTAARARTHRAGAAYGSLDALRLRLLLTLREVALGSGHVLLLALGEVALLLGQILLLALGEVALGSLWTGPLA